MRFTGASPLHSIAGNGRAAGESRRSLRGARPASDRARAAEFATAWRRATRARRRPERSRCPASADARAREEVDAGAAPASAPRRGPARAQQAGFGDEEVERPAAQLVDEVVPVAGLQLHADSRKLLDEARRRGTQERVRRVRSAADVDAAGAQGRMTDRLAARVRPPCAAGRAPARCTGGRGRWARRRRLERRNRSLPNRRSRFWMLRDSAGWLMCRAAAARTKLPCSASATTWRNCCSSRAMREGYTLDAEYALDTWIESRRAIVRVRRRARG